MYAHERSLVQRYQSRPFILLGVNADGDAETLKRIEEERQIPWRSWCDGPPKGPLCTEWKGQGFPTIHLIDADGVVRFSHLGPPAAEELDGETEPLGAEAEKGFR